MSRFRQRAGVHRQKSNKFSRTKEYNLNLLRYTPQQNGVTEWMNHNSTKTQCMLEKVFWQEAVQTAVYLTNWNPTSSLEDKIPAALWYNKILHIYIYSKAQNVRLHCIFETIKRTCCWKIQF